MAKALTTCFCGCGGTTKSKFVPGHDARFHSRVKQVMRDELDEQTAFDSLPHEEAVQEWIAYSEKIAPKEKARKDAEEAKAKAKADAKAAKLAEKATPAVATQETVSADNTLVA